MLASPSHHESSQFKIAWRFLDRVHPSLFKTFFLLVLPLSMLPPAMLYYAGTYHGDAFASGFSGRNWGMIAGLFLLAELATVSVMGYIIRWIARLNGAEVSPHNAQMLAFAAPIPLWLSSLSLLYPSFFFSVAVCCIAFAISCLIVFHGVEVLLQIDEDVTAANIAYGIMGIGMIAWALLLIIVIPIG